VTSLALRATPDGPLRLRVLVVEDELLLRWAISEVLEDAGHTVVAAPDGATALRALAPPAPPVDVMLLDVHLPDSRDFGLLQALQRHVPDSAVVVMTARGSPELVRDAHALGVHRVVDKPFEVRAIEEHLREAFVARLP